MCDRMKYVEKFPPDLWLYASYNGCSVDMLHDKNFIKGI